MCAQGTVKATPAAAGVGGGNGSDGGGSGGGWAGAGAADGGVVSIATADPSQRPKTLVSLCGCVVVVVVVPSRVSHFHVSSPRERGWGSAAVVEQLEPGLHLLSCQLRCC